MGNKWLGGVYWKHVERTVLQYIGVGPIVAGAIVWQFVVYYRLGTSKTGFFANFQNGGNHDRVSKQSKIESKQSL